MGLGKWLNRQMASLAIAMSSVEKDAFGQDGGLGNAGVDKVQRHKQGMLSDALVRGEITQEVKDLRWRMYKVLKATDGITAEIVGYDDDGFPIVEVKDIPIRPLKKVYVDTEDDYDVIMVVDNTEITLGTYEGVDSDSLVGVDGEERFEDGDRVRTIGEIDSENHSSNIKSDRPISISRDFRPKFEIEKYTKKLVVRKISNDERLLEFYLSKYPDEYDRKTRLLISEIKKLIENPRKNDLLDINNVNYITDKTMGAKDYSLYEYSVKEFDKIIEFDGHYVIKFKAIITTNGVNIIEKFRELELDNRYDNKEKK